MDSRLTQDSVLIHEFTLSQLRLMKDGELDWFLLIPKRQGVVEWLDLLVEEQKQLLEEINLVSQNLKLYGEGQKINIASLGNVVPQFHLHIVNRKHDDRAWPGPIWGTTSQLEFNEERVQFWKNHFTGGFSNDA